MDFFQHQDRARQKTAQLVAVFMLGVLATVVLVNLVVFFALWFSGIYEADLAMAWAKWWSSNLSWQVTLGVVGVIVIGTVFRWFELSGGGASVAEWAGGEPLGEHELDQQTRRYRHVAEEMAIAAGMPIPALYVMRKEKGINAFVAGYKPDNAVLVVTQGALNHLSRDQLQGVIGHEYAHILNGDMRLNVRLMSVLAGLVLIGQVGRFFAQFHGVGLSRGYGRSRNDKGALPIMLAGWALMAIGYIGVLVGRIIKAGVSRQREYFADASAVQFTRNPDGLAGALNAISELSIGSMLNHCHAEDMSHFCFGESVGLSKSLATHPPINDRIHRISPNFLAKKRTHRRLNETAEQSVERHQPQGFMTELTGASMMAMAGQVTPDHIAYAQSLYRNIPEQVKDWVHQSAGARAYIYAQIIMSMEGSRQSVVDLVKAEDQGAVKQLKLLWPYCQKMDDQLRLPILELAMPTLKLMTQGDMAAFKDRLHRLAQLDHQITFSECLILSLLNIRLQPNNKDTKALSNKLLPFSDSIYTLFWAAAYLDDDQKNAEQAVANEMERLGLTKPVHVFEHVDFSQVPDALMKLQGISFLWRKIILEACVDIVRRDDVLSVEEYELIRLIADCLSCPVPPMVIEPVSKPVELSPIEYTQESPQSLIP